jgi:Uncharacterized protein conserved in bacteria (DUF2188)
MDECLFRVQQRDDTRWHVCEIGVSRSLASFGRKEDAIEFARELASSTAAESNPAPMNEYRERASA